MAARLLTGVSLTAKLQPKDGHGVAVLNEPQGLELDVPGGEDAVLLFVRTRDELEELAKPFLQAARGDRLAWLAYPKGGRLGTDLNRDVLWELTKEQGVRPVRQVSIDEVWSALRFRPA
jgi:hypothetical protein